MAVAGAALALVQPTTQKMPARKMPAKIRPNIEGIIVTRSRAIQAAFGFMLTRALTSAIIPTIIAA
jgi:hypothetical protein